MKWNVVCRIYGGGSNVRRQYRERRKKTIRFLFLIQPGFDTTASLALERNRMEQQSSLLNVVVLYGLYYIVIDFNHDRFRGRERRETTNIRIIFFNHVPACVKANKQCNTTMHHNHLYHHQSSPLAASCFFEPQSNHCQHALLL